MARLPNTATKEEILEVHKARIDGKKYDAARRYMMQPTPSQQLADLGPQGAILRHAHAMQHAQGMHMDSREIARRNRQAEHAAEDASAAEAEAAEAN